MSKVERGASVSRSIVCVGLALLLLCIVAVADKSYTALMKQAARVDILLACSPGTPKAAVVKRLTGGEGQCIGMELLRAYYPDLAMPRNGSALSNSRNIDDEVNLVIIPTCK